MQIMNNSCACYARLVMGHNLTNQSLLISVSILMRYRFYHHRHQPHHYSVKLNFSSVLLSRLLCNIVIY